MSKIQADDSFQNAYQSKPEEMARSLDVWAQEVTRVVNGQLDFATNFNAKLVTATFSSADTDTIVAHGLGRVPAGYIVTGLSASLVVYNGSSGGSSSSLVLRGSAAGSASLLIF